MFEGLNALPWYNLKHAYGSGEEVPMWLRQLLSSDNEMQKDAIRNLSGSICHQGWISPATAYAVPYLIEVLQEPTVNVRVEILELLAEIADAEPELYEDKWRHNSRVGVYNVPTEIPFQDAHLEASKGIPIYLTLLEDAALDVRIQTTELFMDIATLTPDVQKYLIKILNNETERKVRANLLIMLCNLRPPGPDVQDLCRQILQTDKDDLMVFCAACGLARLEKTATAPEVVQLLATVMLHPPEELMVYGELLCGRSTCWRAAALALGQVGPERLQYLIPDLQEILPQTDAWHMQTLAEMCLFISFSHRPAETESQWVDEELTESERGLELLFYSPEEVARRTRKIIQPWTESELTAQQRSILQLFCDQPGKLWSNLKNKLKQHGLPDTREGMQKFLGSELSSPPPPVEWSFLIARAREQAARYEEEYGYKDRGHTFQNDLYKIFRKHLPTMYPEISTNQVGTRGEGHLLHVDEDFLFLIPDSPAAIASMKREVSLLQTLQGRLMLAIPDPLYTNLDATALGHIFMGYRVFKGKALYKEMLESVPGEEVVEMLALNIADFLYRMHHIPLADISSIGLPITHERKRYELLFERVQMELFPHMQPEICRQIAACFVTFLDTTANFTLEPVLIHGSMGPERIIYDARLHTINGIVGFNQACLDDPAKDIAALLGPQGYGQDFVQRFERVYPELAAMRTRIEFYINATILQTELKRTSEQELKNIASRLTFHSY